MPNYRRYFVPGGTYFFTIVTARRAPIFADEAACHLLGDCLRRVERERPFGVVAIVLLPDHWHTIWTLPPQDDDYSTRIASVKVHFTRGWLARGGHEQSVLPGQQRERRRGVWQPRFSEHTVRDEEDLSQHADYLHYNPVKHGWARCPGDWRFSSFARFVRGGTYPADWGCAGSRMAPAMGKVDESVLE